MQVSVEVTSDLGRRILVETPSDAVEQQFESRLKSLGPQVKIDGFRPGKVPASIVRQRYGSQVRGEVLGEVIQASLQEALSQESLQPVSSPMISNVGEADGQVTFAADFEIFPQIEVKGLEELKVVKTVASVEDSDVDAMIESLRKQRVEWSESDQVAEAGDKITMDFVGKIDGEIFDGGSADGIALELGSGRMIPGFEDQLVGAKTDKPIEVSVDFPENYGKQDLAGKSAVFAVNIVKIETPVLPVADVAFFESLGIGDGSEESCRDEVRNNMELELKTRLAALLKEQVVEGLLDANQIAVPQVLVDQEVERLASKSSGKEGDGKVNPGVAAALAGQAKLRVRLGILLSEVMNTSGLQPDEGRVRSRIENMAQSYEKPEDVIKWYYSDQEQLAQVQNVVLEEQVVDWIAEKADVTEKKVTFSEIVAPAG